MLKLILVDDEKKICDLICNLINWSEYGIEIAGIVYDGIDAIELCKKVLPDIVITDIRMPGLNGLEFIENAKKIKKDISFIIVSGYDSFNYAQTAIKYGVSDYLLKPIKKDELITALQNIIFNKNSNESLQKYKLRQSFFAEIMSNKSNYRMSDVNVNFQYNFQEGFFQIIAIKIDSIEEMRENFYNNVVSRVKSEFSKNTYETESFIDGSTIYILLNYKNKNIVREIIEKLLENITNKQGVTGSCLVTIGVGMECNNLLDLNMSYLTCKYSVSERIIRGPLQIIELEVFEPELSLPKDKALFFYEMICKSIEFLNYDDLNKSVEFIERYILVKNLKGEEIKSQSIHGFEIFIETVANNQLISKAVKDDFFIDFKVLVDKCTSKNEIVNVFRKRILEIYSEILENIKNDELKPIRVAREYIENHYMENISLKEVSELVCYSTAYFSALFKKNTGQNFLEYLQETRINNAKKMLKNSELSIAAICESIGYSDTKTFNKTFKKITGLSPREFRKTYSR